MARIREAIKARALPAVCVGFGSCTFAHKFRALCHTARLEHFSNASLSKWSRELVSSMSDYGVERMLPRVKPVALSQVLPYFEDAADQDVQDVMSGAYPQLQQLAQAHDQADPAMNFEDVDDAASPCEAELPMPEAAFEATPAEAQFDVTAMLDVPALHHLVDNAIEGA